MTDKMINKQIGRYKILQSIGEGGMATVYLAEDTNLEREVALKMIRTEMIPPQQLPRLMERFKREAKALAKLSDDPAIVTVHDYGEYKDTPYLVMAYMPGGTLKDMLGKPMDYRMAAEMIIPVTRALGEAHEQGIIHRDVKPSNLLVDKRGQLALADFGIAKALEMEGQTLTGTGLGVGTPEYMAPEQWRGQASPQTDVYALGVVLYEMVTGKKPFKAENPSDIYLKQMTEAPVPPRELVPGLPGTVEDVLTQAMHKEAGSRFADMDAFCEALQGLVAGEPLHDETPVALPMPVKGPDVAQLDLGATCDELKPFPHSKEVPYPIENTIKGKKKVLARLQEAEAESGENFPQPLEKNRKKWLWPVLGLVLMGVMIGMGNGLVKLGQKGNGPLASLATATETIVPTATLTQTSIATMTLSPTLTSSPTLTFTPLPTSTVTNTPSPTPEGQICAISIPMDNSIPGFMNVLDFTARIVDGKLEITYYMSDLPTQLEVNTGMYEWWATILTNGEEAGGVYSFAFYYPDSGGSPKMVSIENLFSSAIYKETPSNWSKIDTPQTQLDFDAKTITLSGYVPGINSNSIITFHVNVPGYYGKRFTCEP
jgi:serine/threonine protein kinase